MVGVRRLTAHHLARKRSLRRGEESAGPRSRPACARRGRAPRPPPASPAWRSPIALTTLPAKDGCRSPKKLTARPSARMLVQHPDHRRAWRALRLDRLRRRRRPPGNTGRRGAKCSASSRASTVLGRVPAATSTARAGRVARVAAVGRASARMRRGMAGLVHLDRRRRQALGEADALLQRLLDLLVVERVARRVDQAAAIGDGDAAPAVEQSRSRGASPAAAATARSARMARAWAMNSSATGAPPPSSAARTAASPRSAASASIAPQELLDLQRVIGQRLGRRVDRGQAAADHHHRQAQLQIGDGVRSWRRRSAAAPSGSPRPCARPAPGRWAGRGWSACRRPAHSATWSKPRAKACSRVIVPPKRTPPNMAKLRAPLQQQADDLQEVLVPAHGDAVFGDAAEAGHDALVEILVQLARCRGSAGTARGAPSGVDAGDLRRQRLDLQAVDRPPPCGRRSAGSAPA